MCLENFSGEVNKVVSARVRRYEVMLHVETVDGMFNDVYTVNARDSKEARAKAVKRFREENGLTGVKMIQVIDIAE